MIVSFLICLPYGRYETQSVFCCSFQGIRRGYILCGRPSGRQSAWRCIQRIHTLLRCVQYNLSSLPYPAHTSRQQQIATQHSAFPKPLALYKLLSIFGSNILATEGEEWRRHRKIVARCFGETNHRLVWEETIKIVLDLFTHWDRQGNGGEIKVPSVREITREIAIMVIGIAGKDPAIIMDRRDTDFHFIAFGNRTSWEDSDFRPGQHRMVCAFLFALCIPDLSNLELQAGYYKGFRALHPSCCSTRLGPSSLRYWS
jgi:hypothetical protein